MTVSSQKKLKRFLSRLILITITIFLCDLGIGSIIEFFYFKQSSGSLYRTTYAIDCTKAEILVFGSSRANHHYVPEIFEDSLHCTFYNTGRDGNFILYNYAIFKACTERYKPKLIIMDINPNELGFDASGYDRLSSLLPYYRAHPEIKSIVNLRGPFEKFKLISSIYPYNSIMLTIAMSNLDYNRKRKPDTKGYVPIFKRMQNEKITTIQTPLHTDFCFDENKTIVISNIIADCKQNHIKLIFVQSPIYSITRNSYCNSFISELFKKNDVNYFDLSSQIIFINHPEYFADRNHLNDEGARVFSRLTIKLIKATNEPPTF